MFFQYGDCETTYLTSKDKRLGWAIQQIGHINREVDSDLFSAIVHHIIGQQISTKAQATIWQRMQDALGTVTADSIAAAGVPLLQSLGMTFRKAEYITDFAEKIRSGAFNLESVKYMSDADAIRALSSLKGIGVWTAEMILLFCLQRPNVFSYDDCAWYITTAKLTANCLRNIIGDSVRTAAWPVCIYGKSPAVRYRVCAIMLL